MPQSRESSLHPGKRNPSPRLWGLPKPTAGPEGAAAPRGWHSPQQLPLGASSITSVVPCFLPRAVWGRKRRGLRLLPAGAADAAAAGTAPALTSWLPAQGGLWLPRDPRPRWWQIAHRSLGKADSSWLEGGSAQGRAEAAPPLPVTGLAVTVPSPHTDGEHNCSTAPVDLPQLEHSKPSAGSSTWAGLSRDPT